jgi:biofilm protein TabA
MKKKLFFTLSALFFLGTSNIIAQTTNKEWTMSDAKEWFVKKDWSGGLKLKPHPTINQQEFARQYSVNKIYWDKAFTFLKDSNLTAMPVGRHPIDGDNVFAIITENPTKDYDSTQWESHRNYIDLHYVISGEEKIGDYPITKLSVTKPYDASRDVINYSGEGKLYNASPETFFLFFPSDAHKPGVTTGDKKTDKKIVIKIRYAN